MSVRAVLKDKPAHYLCSALARGCAKSRPVLRRHISREVANEAAAYFYSDGVGIMLVVVFGDQFGRHLDVMVNSTVRPILLLKVGLIASFADYLDSPSSTAGKNPRGLPAEKSGN
jgi:hypothetical protein